MLNRFAVATAVTLLALAALPPVAQARDHISVGIGFGGGGYYGGYRGYGGYGGYYPYYSPSYYGYAPTYYAPAPTVIYEQPAPVTYVQPQPQEQYYQPAPQAAPVPTVTQSAPTYTDAKGRTCRPFQSTIDGVPVNGSACQQTDGTWHTTE